MAKKSTPAAGAATQEDPAAPAPFFLENWHHDGKDYRRLDCADGLDPDTLARLLKARVVYMPNPQPPVHAFPKDGYIAQHLPAQGGAATDSHPVGEPSD